MISRIIFTILCAIFCSCAQRITITTVHTAGIELQVSSKPSKYLYNHWLWSREEDSITTLRTYRPKTYNFPPSRSRTGFQIFKNGKIIVYETSPSDKPVQIEGKWVYAKKTNTFDVNFIKLIGVLPHFTAQKTPFSVQIIELEKDKMVIKFVTECNIVGN
ncbi:MAG: hypothetical protein NW207_08210 [Cytophagales bacterium]|nr:hypothetical protein [Cytophagales bacterium]